MVTTENIISISTIIHLGSHILLFCWFWLLILNRLLDKTSSKLATLVLLAIISVIDISNAMPIEYLRSFFGNLSITSILLLSMSLAAMAFNRATYFQQERQQLNINITLLGLFLYPLTLGLTVFDPYSYGYQPFIMGIALLIFTLYCIWRKNLLHVVIILVVISGFTLQTGESLNLWDYLIDPLVFIYAFFSSIKHLAQIHNHEKHQ
jgi:hypothetical protein